MREDRRQRAWSPTVLLRDGLDVGGFGVEIRTEADLKCVHLADDVKCSWAASPRCSRCRHEGTGASDLMAFLRLDAQIEHRVEELLQGGQVR